MSLTTQQQTVLDHRQGHLVVLAGPGSGKTHTLIEKVFHIFDQQIIPEPNGLLAITFSNAAVNEIRTRLRRKNFRHWDRVQVQTFHGFANYILRCYGSDVNVREDFSIIDREAQDKLLDDLIKKHSSTMSRFKFKSFIDGFKRQGIYPQHHNKFILQGEKRFQAAYADYQNHLIDNNQLDFTDLIYFAIKLLRESRLANTLFTNYFRYIIVDEFQDTDHQQLELIQLLAKSAIGSTIVADDDQAIYGFRGGDKRNIQEIQQELQSQLFILQDNFRSPEIIIEAANSLMSKEVDRINKPSVIVSDEKGEFFKSEFSDDQAEATTVVQWITDLQNKQIVNDLGQIAVVTRNRNRSKVIEKVMDDADTAWFDRSRLTFTDTWEANIALAILDLSCETVSSDRLYSLMTAIENSGISYQIDEKDAIDIACNIRKKLQSSPALGIDPQNAVAILERSGLPDILRRVAANQGEYDRLSRNVTEVISSIQNEAKNRSCNLQEAIDILAGKNAVQLITSHGSKGKEFDYVFFIGVEDDVIPGGWRNPSEDEISEDRRIFYVTLTRTRKGFYVTYAKNVSGYPNKRPSRYLNDIPEEYFTDSLTE